MKERLIQLLSADNSFAEDKDIAMYEFGLSRDKYYEKLRTQLENSTTIW